MATYSDRFDPITKRWDRLLFMADRGLQAAELNELQSILNYKIKQLGNVFISDGSVISGCEILTPPDDVYPATLEIGEGLIYIDGSIIQVDQQEITGTFTGSGLEYVYVRSVEEIITESEDSDLLDPAVGIPNYQQVGSHRRVLTASFSNEANKQDDSFVFGFIKDGQVIFRPAAIGADKILDVLAERTYDVEGNFIVDGGNLSLSENENDSTQYDVQVDAYNIYVNGVQYKAQLPQVVTVDKGIQTREQQDLIQVGSNVGNYGALTKNVFQIEDDYIDHVQTCIYPVKKTFSITKGSTDGQDKIQTNPDGDIYQVVSVVQGMTTYTETSDYVVDITEWEIDWSPGGSEPTTGTSYDVEVIYFREFSVGAGAYDTNKYDVYYPNSSDGDYSLAYLRVRDSEYYNLNDSLVINPEYTAFNYRSDAVVVDEDGLLAITYGEYSEKTPPPEPIVSDRNMLLYYITLLPGDYSDPSMYTQLDRRIFNFTQDRLQTMKETVERVRENQVLSALDDDAASMPIGGTMSGIFTDAFETEENADINYVGGTLSAFANSYDSARDDGALTLPILVNSSTLDPTVASTDCRENNSIYTAPFTHRVMVRQSLATSYISINPYEIPFVEPVLNISPRRDVWADHQVINVIVPGEVTNIKNRYQTKIKEVIKSRARRRRLRFDRFRWRMPRGLWLRNQKRDRNISIAPELPLMEKVDSDEREKVLIGTATNFKEVRWARAKTIAMTGENWIVPSAVSNYTIYVTFANKQLSHTATLQSDYSFSGNITLPANTVETGEIPVAVWIEHNSNPGVKILEAESTYFAKGTLQITRKTHRFVRTIHRTVTKYERRIKWVDPLAQSFLFDRDFFCTKITGYFRLKGATERVICELVEMENGYPSQRKLADTSLKPSEVSTSTDATAGTDFVFPDPVFIPKNTEFAVVFRSADASYEMFYAKQGEELIGSPGQIVVAQPYPGVMFKSQNASTWTAIQDSDMKIVVYGAQFTTGTHELVFDTQSALDATWMLLNAEIHEYDNTSVKAYYKTGSVYTEMPEIGEKVQLVSIGSPVPAQNTLKIEITTNDDYVSPIVSKEVGTLYWKYDNVGYYYTKDIDFGADNAFDHVKVRVYGMPNSYSFELELVASDDGTTWEHYPATDTNRVSTSTSNIDENIDIETYLYEWTFDLTYNVGSDGKGWPSGGIGTTLARYAKFMIKLNGDYVDTPLLFDFRVSAYEAI